MIYSKLNNIFCNFFNNNEIVINENTSAADIDGWDSLSHIQLMVIIEKEFNIKFTTYHIVNMYCVGDLVKYLDELTNS